MTTATADAALSRLAAVMVVIAMGLAYAITVADPTILSANMSEVRTALGITTGTASFIASLATLTMAAAVLGAGTLGDLYGMRRMLALGLLGTIAFGVAAAVAPSAAVLVVARAGGGFVCVPDGGVDLRCDWDAAPGLNRN